MLHIENLHKSFGSNAVLQGVNLHIYPGEILVIVGPSGGGKTTLLRSINYLEKCDAGSISLGERYLLKDGIYSPPQELKKIRQDIGLVFQNFNLFPHLSILENIIEAPIHVLGISKEKATQNALNILSFLGLSDKANQYPFQLSGGQKQRVAIGRALALNPKLMCFDEPTSALDPALTDDIANLIKSLKGQGMSMLIITHDMTFAEKVADRIVSMEQGQIVEDHIYHKH